MLFKLIKLDWKSFFRSASFGKGMGVKILLGLLAFYFFTVFLGLGIGLFFIMEDVFPSQEPVLVVSNLLLFWFIGEFGIRYMLQNIPVLDVKPLLVQGIRKSKIVNALLFKSFLSFFNLLTITVALPFTLVNINKSDYSVVTLLFWLLAVVGFSLFLNYINIWIQKRFITNFKSLIPYLITLAVLVGLEYFEVFSISILFGQFYAWILLYPILGLVPVLLASFAYYLAFADLKSNLYLDAYLKSSDKSIHLSDLSWLDRFGVLAPFMQLDLKMIMRNKRAKNTVFMCLFFLLYGLIFYTNEKYDSSAMLVFVGIFMTGLFVINFGQFIPAWDSAYFSLLRVQPVAMENYLMSKVLLLYASILILTLLSSFYIYFGWNVVYLNVVCAIYNLGINVPVILFFSAYNRKRIDLSNGSMFNYEGMGVTQWLISIPLIVIPVVVWKVFALVFDESTANLSLLVLGVFGLLLHKVVIRVVAKMYLQKRYVVNEGFKQKD